MIEKPDPLYPESTPDPESNLGLLSRWGFDPELLVEKWMLWMQEPRVLAALGGVLILLTLILIWRMRRQPSTIKAFTNDKGFVKISRSALVDVIRATSNRLGIERRPGVKVRSKGRRLHLEIRIRMKPEMRLTDVSSCLQDELGLTLREGMGIERLGNINVMVTGIRSSQSNRKQETIPSRMLEDQSLKKAIREHIEHPEGPEDDSRSELFETSTEWETPQGDEESNKP